MQHLNFEQVKVGLTLSAAHAFTARELGDQTLLHADLLSRISSQSFRNSVCANVSLDFVESAFPGEVISVAARVTEVQPAMRSIFMNVKLSRNGGVIARGELTTQFL